MKYKKYTLRNGLRVLMVPMADVESATVMIMTATGSRYESKAENGMAHFLEHMFFRGTPTRPTSQNITQELDAIGGAYNAFTAKDRTAYYAKVPATHINTALDVISDIFLNSTLKACNITKERGPIVQEISMYEDMPARDVHHVFDDLIFGSNHPLGRRILGPKENVLSFKRAQLIKYRERCYTSKNTVIGIAGKFSQKKVLAKIRKDFRDMNMSNAPVFEEFNQKQDASQIHIKHKKTDQTQMILGVPAYHVNHKDRYVLTVLSTILGGGMSSRLFVEVRDKRGLAYSIYTGIDTYYDTGNFYVSAGTEHEKLPKAIKLILQEMKKCTNTFVKKEELTKAKEYIKGHLVLGLETSDDIVSYIVGQEITRNEVRMPEDIATSIDTVTADDIRRVAGDLFQSKKLNLAIIGPHKSKKSTLEKLLKV